MTSTEVPYTQAELSDLTELFEILSAERRVHVIQTLRGEESLKRTEIITEVTKLANPNTEPTGTPRKRITVSLYQQHLPTLHAHGILHWEKDTDTITQGPHYETALELLDSASHTITS